MQSTLPSLRAMKPSRLAARWMVMLEFVLGRSAVAVVSLAMGLMLPILYKLIRPATWIAKHGR